MRRAAPWLLPLLASLFLAASPRAEPRADPALLLGPEKCVECHKRAGEAWRESHHFSSFKSLTTRSSPYQLAERLGLKSPAKEPACQGCHFTMPLVDGAPKPVAGVSCESCHGPARDWNAAHAPPKDLARDKDTPEARAARLERAETLGLRRPARLLPMLRLCFECHAIADEKLVNVGKHSGGVEFEALAWTQGEMRHNFDETPGGPNREAPPERKRLTYLLGLTLGLEASLRAVAHGTTRDTFAIDLARRIKVLTAALAAAAEATGLPELDEAVRAARAAELRFRNAPRLTEAAEAVSRVAERLAAEHDGSRLAALDPLLPAKYRGEAVK